MTNFRFLVLICFISGQQCSPMEDSDVVESIPGELNSIDNVDHDIDIGHLGSEAYGLPKDESDTNENDKVILGPRLPYGKWRRRSGDKSRRKGAAVATWSESSLMNPEEMGEYAEGDILMPKLSRNGMRDQTSRWPNGIVPYVIDGKFNQEQRDLIMRAIADYHRLTCLRFVPYKGQTDYLVIQSSNTGCWSSVGRLGGRQEVNLQSPGCVSKKGTILHEILHALGFFHEQSRYERDDYVTVLYQNIKPGSENNFKKADPKQTHDYGVGYDYNSVMHYSEYAFSKNSQKTIHPKISGVKLGQREGLSRGDVRKLNNMYNCKKEEPQTGWIDAVWQFFGGEKNLVD